MKILLDENIPESMSVALERLGYQVDTVNKGGRILRKLFTTVNYRLALFSFFSSFGVLVITETRYMDPNETRPQGHRGPLCGREA